MLPVAQSRGHQPARCVDAIGDRFDLPADGGEPRVDDDELVPEFPQHRAHHRCEVVGLVGKDARHVELEDASPWPHRDSISRQKARI